MCWPPKHDAIFRLAAEVGVSTYKTWVAGAHLLVGEGGGVGTERRVGNGRCVRKMRREAQSQPMIRRAIRAVHAHAQHREIRVQLEAQRAAAARWRDVLQHQLAAQRSALREPHAPERPRR